MNEARRAKVSVEELASTYSFVVSEFAPKPARSLYEAGTFTTPVPLGLRYKPMFVSSPTASICGAEPVAWLVTVKSSARPAVQVWKIIQAMPY